MNLDVDGPAAPPRRNGELVFDAPWQPRMFGLTAAVVDRCFAGDREPFRRRLIAAIADDPDRPYWDSWTAALEDLVVAAGLLTHDAVDQRLRLGDDEAPALSVLAAGQRQLDGQADDHRSPGTADELEPSG